MLKHEFPEDRAYGGDGRRGASSRHGLGGNAWQRPLARRRLRLWVEVLLWILLAAAVALALLCGGHRLGGQADAMGDSFWQSPVCREVAAERR
jgi:hypothetical protein